MTTGQRWTLVTLATGLVAFGIGTGWQFARANRLATELRTAQEQLTVQRLQNTLAAANIEAQRGNHEQARLLASNFFTMLQDSIGRAPQSARPALDVILGQRDATITALSRAEATAARDLSQLFVQFRAAIGEPIAPEPAAPATPTAPPETTGAGS